MGGLDRETAASILGVAEDASQEAIRRAWRSLALATHPDKHPEDKQAEARFRAVTDAYKILSETVVMYKSYEQLSAEMDDTRCALQRAIAMAQKRKTAGPETPSPEMQAPSEIGCETRDAHHREELLMIGDATWIGGVSNGRPHGHGDLILPNGSVHLGLFDAGRAEGAGTLHEPNGSVMTGTWRENKRVGRFETIDPKGGTWHDVYDAQGKRQSRKKGAPPPPGTPTAVTCRHCAVKFHATRNARCLQHSGQWMEAPTHNADGSAAVVDRAAFPEGGLWLCCGAKLRRGGRGCTVGKHAAESPPPAVPEGRRLDARTEACNEGTATAVGPSDALPSFIQSKIPTRVEYEQWRQGALGSASA